MSKGFNRILVEADIEEPWLEVDDAGLIPHAYDLIKKIAKFKLNHRLPDAYKKMPATMRDREFFTEFVSGIVPKSFPKSMWGDASSIYYSPEFWTIWLKNQDFITNINGELYFYHVVHVGHRGSKNLYFLQTPYEKKVIDAVLNKYNTKGDIDVYVRAEYANKTDLIDAFLKNIDAKIIELTGGAEESPAQTSEDDFADDGDDFTLESAVINCHHKMLEQRLTETRATSIDFVKETLNPLVNDIADKVNDLRVNGDLTQQEFSVLTALLSDISSASARAIEKLDEIKEGKSVLSRSTVITEAAVPERTMSVLRAVDTAAAKANQRFDDLLEKIEVLQRQGTNRAIKYALQEEFFTYRKKYMKWAEKFLTTDANIVVESSKVLSEDDDDSEDEIMNTTENSSEIDTDETLTDVVVDADPADDFVEVSSDQVSLKDLSDVNDLDIFSDILVSDEDDTVTFVVTIPGLDILKDYLEKSDVDEISVDDISYDDLSESTKRKYQQYKNRLG